MSLYLAVFNGEDEVTGWVLGHYSDFGTFRDVISETVGGKRFPVLMTHSDCDGAWQTQELLQLQLELTSIAEEFRKLPARDLARAFEHTTQWRRGARNLYECFHNVDGENLFDALIELANEGIRVNQPIVFQ